MQVRAWIDEEADRRGHTVRVLDGMDAALVGLEHGGDEPMAVYDEQEVVRLLLTQNPGWTLQEARECVEVEIRSTFQVILVETPPREEEPEAPTSIRDGLVARVVEAAREVLGAGQENREEAREWAQSLLSPAPKRMGLFILEMAQRVKEKNAVLVAALAALDDYDRRTK